MRVEHYECEQCRKHLFIGEPLHADLGGTIAGDFRRHFCSTECLLEWVTMEEVRRTEQKPVAQQTDSIPEKPDPIGQYGDRLSNDI